VGTPSPAAASTPRSVKRRLTPGRTGESPDASRHTSPHRFPHAGTGTVRSTAYWTVMQIWSAVASFRLFPLCNAHQLLDLTGVHAEAALRVT